MPEIFSFAQQLPDRGSMESMSDNQPSVFNDVIGPVMRGASSSHCAAALRIGRLALSMMGGQIDKVFVEFESSGALATTHESQGTDMGLFGGLLGWDLTDERLLDYVAAMQASDIEIAIEINDFPTTSPNIYKLTLTNAQGSHTLLADSIGGGMIEVLQINGVPLSIAGDCHETLIFVNGEAEELRERLTQDFAPAELHVRGDGRAVEIKAQSHLDENVRKELLSAFPISSWMEMDQVLPVASHAGTTLPFTSCEEMLAYNKGRGLDLWELALDYECIRGQLTRDDAFDRMREIVKLLQEAVRIGLAGTEYDDRILGYQCGPFRDSLAAGTLLETGMLNEIVLQITAMMEVKSSMGVIVAAPTAGACAALPGSVLGAAKSRGQSVDDMTKAMLAAGMIGIFIATHSTFAAEKAGCQAECGAGSGMAAAALVGLAGGTLEQALSASSMALQNMLGLICDPVAKRVEVPCLGRNVLGASNAVSCANMALAGFNAVIPLDEVIHAMDKIGRQMPCEVRCTGLGGLSVTPTSLEIESALESKCCS
ncbi:MAG: L-serine dehydratase [Candidatus Paceibacteria bacterium]|jgi:L-serine dehydratase